MHSHGFFLQCASSWSACAAGGQGPWTVGRPMHMRQPMEGKRGEREREAGGQAGTPHEMVATRMPLVAFPHGCQVHGGQWT
jgi:hypothetical protein